MKKNLIALIILLTVSLSLSSQTSSTMTEPCKVPCHTLRNALKVKQKADYLDSQLVIVRDSISIYRNIIRSKDTLISYKDTQLTLLRSNERHYQSTVQIQEKVIEDARFDKMVAYILSGASFLVTILVIL